MQQEMRMLQQSLGMVQGDLQRALRELDLLKGDFKCVRESWPFPCSSRGNSILSLMHRAKCHPAIDTPSRLNRH